MTRLALILAALTLTGCQSLTDAIVSAKCGPDGANDYYAGRTGLPTHIACDGPSRGFLSRRPAYP